MVDGNLSTQRKFMFRWSSLKLFSRSIICSALFLDFISSSLTLATILFPLYLHISIILFVLVSLYTLEVWIFLGFNVNFQMNEFFGKSCCCKGKLLLRKEKTMEDNGTMISIRCQSSFWVHKKMMGRQNLISKGVFYNFIYCAWHFGR